jgi:uncharacterized protein
MTTTTGAGGATGAGEPVRDVLRTSAAGRRPLPDPAYPDFAPFWAGTRRGDLVVPSCEDCGRHVWPPRMACPACAGLRFAWSSVGLRGRLYSWTTIGRAMLPGFEDELPYTVVIVESADDPRVRFVGQLAADHSLPAIGDPLIATFVSAGDVTLVHWAPDPGRGASARPAPPHHPANPTQEAPS